MVTERINSAKDLRVYQKAYALAMDIFRLSQPWPPEEKFSLTDQIRRSSRSVCANLREAWAKRRFQAHFISKLTDVDGENSETDTWIDFAMDCGYISKEHHRHLIEECRAIGTMLGSMIKKSEQFLIGNRCSDLRLPTSDFRRPTSDLRPPTSDLRPPTSDIPHQNDR